MGRAKIDREGRGREKPETCSLCSDTPASIVQYLWSMDNRSYVLAIEDLLSFFIIPFLM